MPSSDDWLPPGQHARSDFPRFGLPQYLNRFPEPSSAPDLLVEAIDGTQQHIDFEALSSLPMQQQTSDLHCVTTWSAIGLKWAGVSVRDLFSSCRIDAEAARFAVVSAHDGYRACFHIADLLRDDVLLATALGNDKVSPKHGVPLRLVAPAQYGYKNVKYVKKIALFQSLERYRPAGLKFMEHPRARVAKEERARLIPGWLLRWPYRLLIKRTVNQFEKAWQDHNTDL